MSRIPFLLLFLFTPLSAQQERAPADPPPVSVPAFPNSTCPIMGKKVSSRLFTDTEYGRIWICCKGCDKKILRDVEAAYKTAYPTTKEVANEVCPVSGEKLGEGAVEVTLQGHSFRVCCARCVPVAREHSQVTLARVTDAKVRDLRNAECPVTGEPVVANAFARVGDTIVRLSSPACVAALKKDPAGLLGKAIEIAGRATLPDPRRAEPSPERAGEEAGERRARGEAGGR
ncbi:MAG TPA: hypothetical protein VK081_11790 [Planctomycetota bacterium]|nr:hypothetical protein [Planctomycetota bacterium]